MAGQCSNVKPICSMSEQHDWRLNYSRIVLQCVAGVPCVQGKTALQDQWPFCWVSNVYSGSECQRVYAAHEQRHARILV